MYMSLPKRELAGMVLECNKHIDRMIAFMPSYMKEGNESNAEKLPLAPNWSVVPYLATSNVPTLTTTGSDYTYVTTCITPTSPRKDKGKSPKTRKGGLGKKKRQGTRKSNSKKRRTS